MRKRGPATKSSGGAEWAGQAHDRAAQATKEASQVQVPATAFTSSPPQHCGSSTEPEPHTATTAVSLNLN
jgi:hypothetical protein